MSGRYLTWQAEMARLRADQSTSYPVREERLRTTAGLRGTPALTLSAWRGRSGRRYVVGVHPIDAMTADDFGLVVMMAVCRDADGVAQLVKVGATPGTNGIACRLIGVWLDVVRGQGATEVHLHRLAESWADALAILYDLRGPDEIVTTDGEPAPCS